MSIAATKISPRILAFALICVKLGARARRRGNYGQDNQPILSLDEWGSFCRAVKEYGRWMPGNLGHSAIETMLEVEACMADGYDEEDIHAILAGKSWNNP